MPATSHTDAPTGLVLRPNEAPVDPSIVGGKACGLLRLGVLGIEVPPFVVVSTAAFHAALSDSGVADALAALEGLDPGDRAAGEAAAARVAEAFEVAPLPAGLTEALRDALSGIGDGPLAVRSSAAGEDDAQRSFAGQFDTVLGAQGFVAVAAALRRCWGSAWSARALSYRAQTGLDPADVSMAVVIQALVEGTASGVLFTVDPSDPAAETAILTSAWGLGEGVVSGALATDTFRVPRAGDAVDADVVIKAERLVRAPGGGGGTVAEPVPEADQERRTLTDDEVRELLALGLRVEAAAGRPQDVEWTRTEDGRLVILQARPITGASAPEPGGAVRVWDNSNIVESYPGVTTPLTFSFAHHAYEIVYRLFCEAMGVPRAVIARNDFMFQSMIGLVRGRIYYNILSWYRMFTLLPGYSYNRRFMEQMMGVAEELDVEGDAPAASPARRYLVELPRLLWVGARMVWALLTLERRIAGFRRTFEAAWRDYDGMDFSALSEEALVEAYRDLERRLLWSWKAPIVNDIFSMIFYGVLRRLVDRFGPPDRPALQNDLLAGEGGIESVEPTRAVLQMAGIVRGYKALAQLFAEEDDDAELLRRVREDDRYARLRGPLDRYLDRFGYRCMEELKLESTSLKDDPTFLVRMIRNYVGRPDIDPDAMLAHERQVRRAAEEAMDGRIPSWPWRVVFRYVLGQARRRVKERENLRFARTRVFGLAREIFDAFGRRLAARGVLEGPRDVYYLTVPEIVGFVEGTTPTTDLAGLVALRRAEFARFEAEDPPDDRFPTRGPVHAGNRFRAPRSAPTEPVDGVLTGTPCCPGVLRLPARVIRSPRDDLALNGEILVAERTDPGWVPLYPAVSGLLIERGSVLSHSAIVAREMGLPTIVGIAGLTAHVADGQEIEMDGAAGTVALDPA